MYISRFFLAQGGSRIFQATLKSKTTPLCGSIPPNKTSNIQQSSVAAYSHASSFIKFKRIIFRVWNLFHMVQHHVVK